MVSVSRHYLDHNATSPLRPEAREAILNALEQVGNPSSVHQEGRKARGMVDGARDAIAALCGASARDVVFTGGGTEANSLALTPGLLVDGAPQPFTHLVVSSVEHVCILEGHRFKADCVSRINVDPSGIVSKDHLELLLQDIAQKGGRALVAIQAANNETGILQPIPEFAMLVHRFGGLLHCDAVQIAGKLPLDQMTAGADMIALSAHKIGGPQGVGALVLRSGGISITDKMLRGGGQERGARAGTENVAGILGFGAAASACLTSLAENSNAMLDLRDHAETLLIEAAPDAVVYGSGLARLPNTLAFSIPGLTAETALMAFDLGGVALSSGSACSSGKVKKSHVLEAMGVSNDIAACALRVSFGWTSTKADLEGFRAVLEKMVRQRKTNARAA